MKNKINPLKQLIMRVSEYNGMADIGEIARRYFVMNAFDGVLTIMGVLMGNLAANVESTHIVVTTGLTTCIAMGISGLWGSYLTESAERKRDLDDLSKQTLTDLNVSRLGKASKYAAVIISLVDGFSPFLASLIVLIPFFFPELLPNIQWAYYTSLATGLLTLFGLGIFLGNISKQNLLVSGLKTVFAGIIAILISTLIGVD